MTDYQAISTFGMTLLGSGIGSSLIGIWFKRHFDAEIEKYKALLQRGSRIHERQIDALLELYSKMEHAQFYMARATSSAIFEGESREELLKKTAEALSAAGKLYSERKLLIPQPLTLQLNEFFELFQTVRMNLGFAMWEPTQGEDKAKLWATVQETAHQKLPHVLAAIEATARKTIHSEE